MLNKDCEEWGGKYCMCETCQSMRKILDELTELKGEDIIKKGEARKIFKEMEASLDLKNLKKL